MAFPLKLFWLKLAQLCLLIAIEFLFYRVKTNQIKFKRIALVYFFIYQLN